MRYHNESRSPTANLRNLLLSAFVCVFLLPISASSQERKNDTHNRNFLMTAAKELMISATYCALITVDDTGHPQARTMDPFAPEDDMVVWLGTNTNSRKVKEIKHDSRITLYYQAPNGGGYVVLKGHAYLVNDGESKKKYWKKEWNKFYPEKNDTYLLIKTVPDKLEIVSYKHKLTGDSKTWEAPSLNFKSIK